MSPFLCPKVFFLLFFCSFCVPFSRTPAGKHFCALKCFFRFFVAFLFLFPLFYTPAVKMKNQLYLCLYPLANLHKVKFIEKIAAYNS